MAESIRSIHAAIDDGYCEKGSLLLYWRHGALEHLLGSD